jgi:uncharacterized membrane protein YgaE (UPF0421/DUF939 family)
VLSTGREVLRRWVRRGTERARERGAKAVGRALRLTGAAVAAYVVAEQMFPGTKPLLAPLTALLVVQVTLYSTLLTSVQRVASVVAGVLVALLVSSLLEFSPWSLAVLIAGSIMIGQLLHLREQMLEVPISAMLVLAVGATGASASAVGRITETLVGAAVGVLYNVLLPGPVESHTAGEAVEAFADDMSAFLTSMANELADGLSEERAGRWLDRIRTLTHQVGRVDRVLVNAEESRKLNVRALGTMDTAPSLRSGLDALEHCVLALRSLCRALLDQVRQAPDEAQGGYSPDVREVFAVLFHDLAAAVAGFGRLVCAEAETVADPDKRTLATALDTVREARARLTDLLLLDPYDDPERWALNGTVLASVERVLREIDVEERLRQRARRRREWEERATASQAVDRLRATSRQVARFPLLRHQATASEGAPGGLEDETPSTG